MSETISSLIEQMLTVISNHHGLTFLACMFREYLEQSSSFPMLLSYVARCWVFDHTNKKVMTIEPKEVTLSRGRRVSLAKGATAGPSSH